MRLESRGTAVNVAALMPAVAGRRTVMGERTSEATPAEQAAMAALADEALAAGARPGGVSDADVRGLLASGIASVGSGTAATAWTEGEASAVDPAAYGSIARVLEVHAGEDGVFDLPEGIRRLTSFAARRLGIADRGLVREGYFADLVVFDPALVSAAGPAALTPYARGIAYVVVNGVVTVVPDGHTGSRAGRWLDGPGTADAP